MALRLSYAALSDVGNVRKDNQDSGYAGPWVLAVCDGVGGAARGDIASSTAIAQLAKLDRPPGGDLLGAVAGALHRAHDRIGELVESDPALSGTSTTATVVVFDGAQIGVGHIGDSRAYLYRAGELSQLTKDHTFVQSLIDDGRITEAESRVHPHRNLILQAVDGVHDTEPDLLTLPVAAGDRLMLCSDGASGVLAPERIADILGTGTPDFATVELVRAALEAGSSDNVTCLVADVVPDGTAEGPDEGLDEEPTSEIAVVDPDTGDPDDTADPEATRPKMRAVTTADLSAMQAGEPMTVGAAAEMPRRRVGRFRGHRSGDTGEMEAIDEDLPPGAILTDPAPGIDWDPETARYAPRDPGRFGWLRALLAVVVVVGLVWIAVAAAWSWTQRQFFVGSRDGVVTIYRGLDSDVLWLSLSDPYESSDVRLSRLSEYDAGVVEDGIAADSLSEAHDIVDNLASKQDCSDGCEP